MAQKKKTTVANRVKNANGDLADHVLLGGVVGAGDVTMKIRRLDGEEFEVRFSQLVAVKVSTDLLKAAAAAARQA